jgi:uncharacterized protein (TIGR02452 family)
LWIEPRTKNQELIPLDRALIVQYRGHSSTEKPPHNMGLHKSKSNGCTVTAKDADTHTDAAPAETRHQKRWRVLKRRRNQCKTRVALSNARAARLSNQLHSALSTISVLKRRSSAANWKALLHQHHRDQHCAGDDDALDFDNFRTVPDTISPSRGTASPHSLEEMDDTKAYTKHSSDTLYARHNTVDCFPMSESSAQSAGEWIRQYAATIHGGGVAMGTLVEVWTDATSLDVCRSIARDENCDKRDATTVVSMLDGHGPFGSAVEGTTSDDQEMMERQTSIYWCLADNSILTEAGNPCRLGYYTDRGTFSKRVPIVKDSNDEWCSPRYYIDIISVPAVITTAPFCNIKHKKSVWFNRLRFALEIAALRKVKTVVIPAAGMTDKGVSSRRVARWCNYLINGEFRDVFERVIVAVSGTATAAPFEQIIGGAFVRRASSRPKVV